MTIDTGYKITALTGKQGDSISVRYSPDTEFTDVSPVFRPDHDIYMETSTNGINWSAPMKIVGEDAIQYVATLTISSSNKGILSASLYKDGVIDNQKRYCRLEYSIGGAPWTISEAITELTGNLSYTLEDDYPQGISFRLFIYSDSEKNDCIASAECSVSASGSSAKVVITDYLYTQSQINTCSADGYSGVWNITGNNSIRVGDTVYIRVTNISKSAFCYIVAIVTEVTSDTSIICTSYGLIDKGDKGDQGERGESGTNFMLDLFPDQMQVFANNDGTCTEENITTQCYLSFNTEYVTEWTLSVKHKDRTLINGTDANWTWNQDHYELSIPTRLLENDSESFEIYATFIDGEKSYNRIAILQVNKYKGVEYLDFDLDYSSIKVSYDGVTPVISPKIITPKKYKKTSSGQFQTQEGYLTVQQFDGDGKQIGDLKEVGYIKIINENFDSKAEYKAKMSPYMAYGYNNKGTVDNGVVLGDIINGQFVAWVFYDRVKE